MHWLDNKLLDRMALLHNKILNFQVAVEGQCLIISYVLHHKLGFFNNLTKCLIRILLFSVLKCKKETSPKYSL